MTYIHVEWLDFYGVNLCSNIKTPWHSSTIKLTASAQRTFIALRRPLIDILSVDKPWTNHGQTMDNSKENIVL